ncbi:PAS domain-containing sensor histidine kinase [Nocardioidaceae bacterium]|nr:PAS domain-containing sensor histidine kinase [Nocardioidaceae bacterium]
MTRRATTPVLVAVLLVVLLAGAAFAGHPGYALTWPAAGLACLVLLRVPTPADLGAAVGLAAFAAGALLLGGCGTPIAVASGLAIAAGALVTRRVLRPGPSDFDVVDARSLLRLVVGVALGASTSALVLVAVAHSGGVEVTGDVILVRLASTASSMLLLLPLHRLLRSGGSEAWTEVQTWAPAEAWTQRCLLIALALFCLLQPWSAVLPVALVVPALWSALRAGRREVTLQAVGLCTVAYVAALAEVGPASVAASRGFSTTETLVSTLFFIALAGAFTVPPDLVVRAHLTTVGRERQFSRSLELVLHASDHVAIMLTDATGSVQQANGPAAAVAGAEPEDLVGLPLPWFDLAETHGQGAGGCTAAELPAILARASTQPARDHRVRMPDDSWRWFEVKVDEVRDGALLHGWLITASDITERAELEHSLRRALERDQQSLRLLTETDRFKDELVSTISHELRTPIASIVGYAEMLAEELERQAPDLLGFLEPVTRNARRLHGLVDDLVLLDALESSERVTPRAPVDLRAVVLAAVTRADSRAPRGVRVTFGNVVDDPRTDHRICGDAAQLTRAVDALLDNAMKFSPELGRVRVDLVVLENPFESDDGTQHTTLVLTVHDDGQGVAAHDLGRVFDRFYRSTSVYEAQVQGSGLGLALCKAIIEAHGGDITLARNPRGGTDVTCLLPVPQRISSASPRLSRTVSG